MSLSGKQRALVARTWACSWWRGGLCRSHEGAAGVVLECEERDLGGLGGPRVFVPISRNRLWVLKVVGGQSAVKGDLKASTLLDELVAKLRAGQGDTVDGPATPVKDASAAAGVSPGASAAAGEGARDPMAAPSEPSRAHRNPKRGRRVATWRKPRRNKNEFLEAPASE